MRICIAGRYPGKDMKDMKDVNEAKRAKRSRPAHAAAGCRVSPCQNDLKYKFFSLTRK